MDAAVFTFLKSKRFWTFAVTMILRQFGIVDDTSVETVVAAALILWPILDKMISNSRASL